MTRGQAQLTRQIVQWEQNASDTEPVEMVLARSTQEAIVVPGTRQARASLAACRSAHM